MTELREPRQERVDIDRVIPYWRNPRRLSQEAVEAVKQSIQAYGYSQPIVVDASYTIIVGHTRYSAMRSMGVKEVEVAVVDYLDPIKVKQLRVVDNRAGEYSFWDFEKLMTELETSDSDLMKGLFPEMRELDEDEMPDTIVVLSGSGLYGDDVDMSVEFVCPTCFHEWEQMLTKDQIMSGAITQEN
jgi:hypothetical protein